MAVQFQHKAKKARGRRRALAAWAWLGLILPSASCVPAGFSGSVEIAATATATAPQPRAERLQAIEMTDQSVPTAPQGWVGLFGAAIAANAATPVSSGPNPSASAYSFAARTPIDRMRSHDCLAQAIYYEARSESEDGQRAVAQVVLNRVRHPAWPNSICGVVYQGPMRPGGGCQFTFTCDGSLAYRASGPTWDRAQRLAAEAIAGRVYAPIGMSTHYHTSAVFPAWAPRLVKTAVIGAHNFYRLPGLAGAPGAFDMAYAGNEPVVRASFYMAGSRGGASSTAGEVPAYAPPTAAAAAYRPPAPVPSDIPQDSRWAVSNIPESTVREEYRQSGQWRED
ncbi:MAG TPA: cell wall hydrolase, partial [Allosphingosinicella sp.]|nr:cell wall hydrolase [Allosphingosinicella sp.]